MSDSGLKVVYGRREIVRNKRYEELGVISSCGLCIVTIAMWIYNVVLHKECEYPRENEKTKRVARYNQCARFYESSVNGKIE